LFLYFCFSYRRYDQNMPDNRIVACTGHHLNNMQAEFAFYYRRYLPFLSALKAADKKVGSILFLCSIDAKLTAILLASWSCEYTLQDQEIFSGRFHLRLRSFNWAVI
jgi:hypothetical protein